MYHTLLWILHCPSPPIHQQMWWTPSVQCFRSLDFTFVLVAGCLQQSQYMCWTYRMQILLQKHTIAPRTLSTEVKQQAREANHSSPTENASCTATPLGYTSGVFPRQSTATWKLLANLSFQGTKKCIWILYTGRYITTALNQGQNTITRQAGEPVLTIFRLFGDMQRLS
jgi:hypothetical protein